MNSLDENVANRLKISALIGVKVRYSDLYERKRLSRFGISKEMLVSS